jgi:hypothetical protein
MLGSIEFLVYLGLVGILVVWFILPLVPAILLYWLFPDSRIKAEGVLANFPTSITRRCSTPSVQEQSRTRSPSTILNT